MYEAITEAFKPEQLPYLFIIVSTSKFSWDLMVFNRTTVDGIAIVN